MLILNLFSTLHGILVALTVCVYQVEANHQKKTNLCAKNNEICDPRNLRACCDDNYTCKLKKSRNDFVCGEKVILNGSCANDEECSDIKHAKCSKDKLCVCITNNIRVNETYCAPALRAFCWKGEKCATDNASCINNECQCNGNSVQQSTDQCLPKLLGSSCETNSDCERVKFSKCSATKTCICSLNTLPINGASCVPILNDFCQTNDDCKVENSECIKNVCKCKVMFKTIANTECKEPHVGMACSGYLDCHDFIVHSFCSKNMKCTCKNDHVAINDKTCAPAMNVTCRDNEICAPENSICTNNICQCEPDYVYRGTNCVPEFLGMPCKTEKDCQETRFSTCSDDNVCVCKSDYIESGSSTCLPLIGGRCIHHENCVVKNSHCSSNECKCIHNYVAHSNDVCTPLLLERLCMTYKDCEDIENSYCSIYAKCLCRSDSIAINGTKCLQPLNQFCTKSKPCMRKNSICINNECQCEPNFVKHLNAECIPRVFDDICLEDSHCVNIGQKCSSNQTCICEDNYIALSSTKCAPLLNGYCSSNNDCYVKNSICVSNRCQCQSYHLTRSNYECEPNILGKPCATDLDCKHIKNSRCSSDNVCACEMHYFALDKFFCAPALHGFCSSDRDCYFGSFHCTDNQCQCKSNHTAVSINKCVETHLISSCTHVSECSDSWHSACSLEGKCVCALNNIAVGPSTCLPILDGTCWRDDQCIAENSACIDYTCQCKDNFVAIGNNICILVNSKKI